MAALLGDYQHDPVLFVREVLGVEPDPWQEMVLWELADHGRVSVAACHGPGKDAVASWAVLWVMCCFEHPKVPCTAPTSHQLYDLLWSEIAKWKRTMLPWFADQLDVKRDRIEMVDHPETWFAAARTARKENPEALQGFHADVILVVTDEASGIPPIISEVLEGAMTGPRAMWLMIGNPTQTTGYFYESHHADRDRWSCFRVMAAAAHDGKRLPEDVYVSHRVSSDYVEAMARKYGRDSNVFRVRVLGLFPTSEDDQVILLEWLEAARRREVDPKWLPSHHVVVGLDVALFGSDDSAICVRQGPVILALDTWHGHDRATTAGKAIEWCKRLTKQGNKPRYLFVDGCGVGAGVVKLLRQKDDKGRNWLYENQISVVNVNAGAMSPDPECARLRDAMWWRGRKSFDPNQGNKLGEVPIIPNTLPRELADRLTGELAMPKFDYNGTMKIKVESKEEMKARGIGSPDLADAYLLTLYHECGMPPPPKKERPWDTDSDKDARFAA